MKTLEKWWKDRPDRWEDDPLCPVGYRFLFQGKAKSAAHFSEWIQAMFLPLYPTMMQPDVVRISKGMIPNFCEGNRKATTKGFTAYIRKDVQSK